MTDGFLDIHHHIIHGVDDGPGTLEEAAAMLKAARADGITHLVATSHAVPDAHAFPLDRYYRRLDALNALSEERGIGVSVYEGCEALYSQTALRQLEQGRLPTLAGGRYVLLEFGAWDGAEKILNGLRQVANAGFVPVIAHAERYGALAKEPRLLLNARGQFAMRIQMNCETVAGKPPWAVRRFRDLLLGEGAVDYLGTDAHNVGPRRACMRRAYEESARRYGRRRAFQWTGGNQNEIFDW